MTATTASAATTPGPVPRLDGGPAGRPHRPIAAELTERLASIELMDRPVEGLAGAVRRVVGRGAVKDALSGTWLGHVLHPLLTDVTIGAWTSASILDVVGGEASAQAAERLIAAGIVSALPTAASGMSDWADTTLIDDAARRVGIVHAVSNVAGLALYTASLVERRRGRRTRGIALGLAGLGAVGAGGYLGGELAFSRAVGVDRTALQSPPREWTAVLAAANLPEGRPRCARAGDVDVLLVRRGERVFALADRCTHRGGPLHDGTLSGDCVTCPWHGSEFRLQDGSVVQGPASQPQPAFDVRVAGGMIEVRPRGAGDSPS